LTHKANPVTHRHPVPTLTKKSSPARRAMYVRCRLVTFRKRYGVDPSSPLTSLPWWY
jgi:hypothetical protein